VWELSLCGRSDHAPLSTGRSDILHSSQAAGSQTSPAAPAPIASRWGAPISLASKLGASQGCSGMCMLRH